MRSCLHKMTLASLLLLGCLNLTAAQQDRSTLPKEFEEFFRSGSQRQVSSARPAEPCSTARPSADADKIISACTQIIAKGTGEPTDKRASAYVARGFAYLQYKHDYARAIRDYDEAIRLDPKNAAAFNGRGVAYHQKGDVERAVQDYDQAIRFDPKLAAAYSNRGFANDQKGKFDQAIKDYDSAIRLDPNYANAYGFRALWYFKAGDYDRAIRDYNDAIRLDPKTAAHVRRRGLAYEKKGDNERARKDLFAALALNPNDKDAREALARVDPTSPALAPPASANPPASPEPRRGRLGVNVQRVTAEIAASLGMSQARGALVASVDDVGPAQLAGIVPGDVILSFDGHAITEHDDLPRFVANVTGGKDIPIMILRNRQEETRVVKLGPADKASPAPAAAGKPLGLSIANLTAELRQQYKLKNDIKGVIIVGVVPGSAAADKNLKAGEVILRVGSNLVTTAVDVGKLLDQMKRSDRASAMFLITNAENNQRFVVLPLK